MFFLKRASPVHPEPILLLTFQVEKNKVRFSINAIGLTQFIERSYEPHVDSNDDIESLLADVKVECMYVASRHHIRKLQYQDPILHQRIVIDINERCFDILRRVFFDYISETTEASFIFSNHEALPNKSHPKTTHPMG